MTHPQYFAGCEAGSSFVQNVTKLAAPKFAIGHLVVLTFNCEGCDSVTYRGSVVGLFPHRPGDLAGWWYVIRCTYIERGAHLPLPYDEEVHESELKFYAPLVLVGR